MSDKKVKIDYKKYIKENDEIRNGFKVTANRKKVWNIQIGLLEELKKICKKHNIKYYAYGGTLLGAIRHGGYIPWDDDLDVAMFREDYKKFWEIAEKELPNNIKLSTHFAGFSKLINQNTAALGDECRRNEYLNGGIRIDIFPMDIASKFKIINQIKTKIIYILDSVLLLQKTNWSTHNVSKRKLLFIPLFKLIFGKIGYLKTYQIQEIIIKNVFFKGKDIRMYGKRFFPISIFNKYHDVKFENTTICVPDSYDKILKMTYGDYMKPIIWEGGHNCRYSVNESYKDIIKEFDKSKSDEENYNNCPSLFLL